MIEINCESVFDVFDGGDILTTLDVVDRLAIDRVHERSVRAAVSWLTVSGHVRHNGFVTRHTPSGHPYLASCYVWTGKRFDTGRQPNDCADLAAIIAGWRRS